MPVCYRKAVFILLVVNKGDLWNFAHCGRLSTSPHLTGSSVMHHPYFNLLTPWLDTLGSIAHTNIHTRTHVLECLRFLKQSFYMRFCSHLMVVWGARGAVKRSKVPPRMSSSSGTRATAHTKPSFSWCSTSAFDRCVLKIRMLGFCCHPPENDL